jgi:hypothetical protein
MLGPQRGAVAGRGRAGKKPRSVSLGHLTAIHDAMFTALRLGERLHPELDGIFITQPDRTMPLPTSEEIAKYWEAIYTVLLGTFTIRTSHEWL